MEAGSNLWVFRILSDRVCHLCLEFEAMSHGEKEKTEDY